MKPSAPAPFSPTLLEKLCALRAVPPFDRIEPSDLALLADIAEPHTSGPGDLATLASSSSLSWYGANSC